MATIEKVYNDWEESFKSSEESLFHYHPSLERIILGFAIYVISSRPLFSKMGGKAESLKLLYIYATGLITAWIDENDDAFETMFKATMPIAEAYLVVGRSFSEKYPSEKKNIRNLTILYTHAIALAGDMKEELAEELLDDLSTDGDKIYSDKIQAFGDKLFHFTTQYGIDIPLTKLSQLLG